MYHQRNDGLSNGLFEQLETRRLLSGAAINDAKHTAAAIVIFMFGTPRAREAFYARRAAPARFQNNTFTPADNRKPARSIGSKPWKSRPSLAAAQRYRPSHVMYQRRQNLMSTPPKACALGVHPFDWNTSEKTG